MGFSVLVLIVKRRVRGGCGNNETIKKRETKGNRKQLVKLFLETYEFLSTTLSRGKGSLMVSSFLVRSQRWEEEEKGSSEKRRKEGTEDQKTDKS
jgi:hypothetical protein